MKVLWFTNTPSLYKKGNHHYHGGGWIKSLEQLFTEKTNVQLGICFFHATDNEKQKNGSVTYYPVHKKKEAGFKRLLSNWSGRIHSPQHVDAFLKVIEDFQPDIIQIFGTENAFSLIQPQTKIPVVIHLQGLMLPYENAFYPSGINYFNILFEPRFYKKHLLGNSLLFDKKRFKKQALRELSYFKEVKYLMGRTAWDKSISGLLAPNATYFHADEVLRPVFYDEAEWNYTNKTDKIIIMSTISNTIYKGFDLILKTASLLKSSTSLSFEWRIAGLNKFDRTIAFFERQTGIKCSDCNVKIIGTKNSAELIEILKEADVFVHPSYIENSPNSICEAQLLGMPIIACNTGGIPTIIENGVTGILIPANSPYELAAQIKHLLSDYQLAKSLGKEGRKAAQQRHDRNKILSDITGAYEQILKSSLCNK